MTKSNRRKCTEELKREAVKLVVEEGPMASEVARNLGIDRSMLDRWRQQFGEEPQAGSACTSEKKEKLRRLRAESSSCGSRGTS